MILLFEKCDECGLTLWFWQAIAVPNVWRLTEQERKRKDLFLCQHCWHEVREEMNARNP